MTFDDPDSGPASGERRRGGTLECRDDSIGRAPSQQASPFFVGGGFAHWPPELTCGPKHCPGKGPKGLGLQLRRGAEWRNLQGTFDEMVRSIRFSN